MFLAKLTKKEKKLVRAIVKLQLASLEALLDGTSEEDLDMTCIQAEISKGELLEMVQANLERFEEVMDKPGLIFSMHEDNIDICKTLLHRYFRKKIKHEEAYKKIWKKFKYISLVPEYPPMPN